MNLHRIPVYWILACAALAAGAEQPAQTVGDWKIEAKGAWKVHSDAQRDLLVMEHPWAPSETGGFAQMLRKMRIAPDWTGPVYVCFYCSDDYSAAQPPGANTSAEGFRGHRFKQILVDSTAVWSEDVADSVEKGKSPYYRVPIPVKPGQEFLLSLLVYDRVASSEVGGEDFYQASDGSRKRPEGSADPFRFMTHVYWGDIALAHGEAPGSLGQRKADVRTRERHTDLWPLPPVGDGWAASTARLTVDGAERLPKEGFPLEFGVPVPSGKAKSVAALRFLDADGTPRAAQKTALGTWPGQSVRWMLADLAVHPGMKAIDLAFQNDTAEVPPRNLVDERDEGTAVNCGRVSFTAAAGDLLNDVRWNGNVILPKARLRMRTGAEDIAGTCDKPLLLQEGPFRTTLSIPGRFDGLESRAASFIAYCSGYNNLPYLRIAFRIFNDTGKPLSVSALELEFEFKDVPKQFLTPGQSCAGTFQVSQRSESARKLEGGADLPNEPFYLAWDGGAVAVRRFRELFPKAAGVRNGRLVVDLVAGSEGPVVFNPGEAKAHEVWFAFGGVDPAAFADAIERPPILVNPAYYCATGVLGPAYPIDVLPGLAKKLDDAYQGKSWGELGQHFGLRDFPDAPYGGGLPNWCNNYYERMLGLWSQWFMSGKREWYDRAADMSQHILDTAVIHGEIPGTDWIGAIHGPGKDHAGPPWNPALRTAGLDLYHKLTGDPEARYAFLGAADFAMRTRAGIDGSSIRQQAAPFDAICTAFAETAEPKYLDEGATRVASALKSVDARRGAWPDEHGSSVYRGTVPWMAAQMARPLYQWYRATGDVAAAQLLVGLAESVACENAPPGQLGQIAGYSHNPAYAPTAEYDPLILPMIFAAYELSGDEFFLKAGTAQYQRWCAAGQPCSIFNTYFNMPWLAWYVHKYNIPAKPEEASAAKPADKAPAKKAAEEKTPPPKKTKK